MPSLEQIPGRLDVKVTLGDDLVLPLQFNIALTGYTFAAAIGGQTPTIDSSQAASGLIVLSLSEAQTTALGVCSVKWWFQWTVASVTRTVLSGTFAVQAQA